MSPIGGRWHGGQNCALPAQSQVDASACRAPHRLSAASAHDRDVAKGNGFSLNRNPWASTWRTPREFVGRSLRLLYLRTSHSMRTVVRIDHGPHARTRRREARPLEDWVSRPHGALLRVARRCRRDA
jgi:hypothetical protein